ncbi:RidA family protein [Rhodobium gokarnense]|uniref:Enamine deaminase RidA (YjgF/YER057c/UK114 family) n=1 Tax=Rhodobium gokarnense TaxID=364296 RepID=A0ABT3H652_9HYPH|nr:RidA family protein [Rhodobium gokarnense]MCW2305870.1 enamine deaminase RidA (YjgF/YER057c/UK114 family) [Rhodobium gokarnense]
MITHYTPAGHKSDMVAYNGMLFVSGIVASDLSLPVEGQAAEILAKFDTMLAEAGTSKERLLSATIWLADIDDRAKISDAWNAWVVPGKQPARVCIGAALAAPDIRIEIALVAAV